MPRKLRKGQIVTLVQVNKATWKRLKAREGSLFDNLDKALNAYLGTATGRRAKASKPKSPKIHNGKE